MPNGQGAELPATLLEEMIVALGSGIGRAQAELDRHSIATQDLINADPLLAQYGLEATWYQMPKAEVELKVAIMLEESGTPLQEPGPGILPPKLWLQPVNPRVQNQFSYDVQAATTVTLTIVPVPPPGRAAAARPAMTVDQALAAARPRLFPTTDLSLPPEDRITINFNPGSGLWYVLQTRQVDDRVELRALVRVDDATGQIVSAMTGP